MLNHFSCCCAPMQLLMTDDCLTPPPSVSRLKNTTKECNAQLQSIVELQKAVNEGEDKNAELRRELEEKTVELAKEVSCWVVYPIVTNAS